MFIKLVFLFDKLYTNNLILFNLYLSKLTYSPQNQMHSI